LRNALHIATPIVQQTNISPTTIKIIDQKNPASKVSDWLLLAA
jgi:hypothetical protein